MTVSEAGGVVGLPLPDAVRPLKSEPISALAILRVGCGGGERSRRGDKFLS